MKDGYLYSPSNDLWEYSPTSKEWTWQGGTNQRQEGFGAVYGTQGVPAVGNIPGPRYGAVSWTDGSGNLWLFGGNDWLFGSNDPGACYLANCTPTQYLNDLWKLNPTNQMWTWVSGANTANQPGIYGTQGIPSTGNVPGARYESVSWIDQSGNLWLFGGNGYDSTGNTANLNDLWMFNPTNKTWTWVSGANTANQPGIYGTQGIPSTGNVPGARQGAVSWNDKSGNLWLFGGYGFDSIGSGSNNGWTGMGLNDLWDFRQFTGTLSSISVAPANTSILVGRSQQFTATGTYSDSSTQNLTGTVVWTSSNTRVATVNSTGVVTAVAAGSTYISASLNGVNSNTVVLSVVSGAYTAPTETVGTASGTQTATILFSSSFTLGSISVVTQGATGLDFNYASGGTCTAGTAYTTGQICTVNYTFTPLAPGQRMGAIVIKDGSGNVQATEYISGMGIGPEAAFSPGIISTVAGNGTAGYNNDGIAATSAELNVPGGIAVDSVGNVFIADFQNNRIRKVSASTGLISTVAGNGTGGYNGDSIPATSAEIYLPDGVAVDGAGNIYISDNWNCRIRKVNAVTGLISTVAGNGTWGYNGDGIAATSAELRPAGVAVDSAGNIYIDDSDNVRIRKVSASTGLISTVAGNGTGGYNSDGIAATSAELNIPTSVALDSAGNIFIADFQNNRIRKVSASTGLISTVAGNGTAGYNSDGIAATSAELNGPSGVAVDSAGNIYIADTNNERIRKVSASTGLISTVSVVATSVAVDSTGNIYFSNSIFIQRVSAAASGLSFASTAVGSTSSDSPQTVTLWNNGNTALTLPIPTSGNNPSIASNFTLNSTGGTACPLIGSTSSSAGTLAVGASCTLPISFAPTAAGTISGSLVVTDNSMNGTNVMQTISLGGTATLAQASQTITFTPPSSPVTYGVAPISLSASASSGLAVTFSVISGPGTVSGSTLTVTGVGTIVVAANQAGNANYTAATQVTQSIVVNQASPTITFTVPNHTYGDAPFTVTATSNSSGAITYSVVSGPATISGSTVTLTGAGTVVPQASQVAAGNYAAKTQTAMFTVAGNAPTINFTVPNHTYGDAPFTVSATSNSSGAITYSVVSGPATISGSTVTLTGAGSVVLQASQVAAGNYAAGTQTATVTVAKESQTITFSAPASPVNYGVAPISLSASASSGLAVAFNVVSGPGTISGSTLTITGAGTVVVAANQAGNTNYAAATQVTQTITVNQASQTISFTAPTSPVTYGVSPITLVATGGASGNAVAFSVVSGPATVSGSTLTITGAGTVVVAANQTGNTNYAAATQVTQTITVNQASQTISFTAPASPVTYGVSPITLSASSTSGLAVTFSVVSGPGTVSGSTLTITGVGTVVVAANQAGNANYAAATQMTQSIVVNVIGAAATPTFSPVAGTYTATQTVTISDATAGATIYYTTNGTAPTTSSPVYSGAITVSSTETLEAIATATGYSTSTVASAAYTINIPTNPVPAISGISPAFTNAGGTVFTLTVNGSGFIASSTVYWGTSALTTTYVSATQLTAQVPAADTASAGTNAITVQNPAPGGGTSNIWQFEVDSVSSGSTAPTITSTTETVAAGSTASYPVTVPSSVTSVSVTCLNLPTGASCSYSATTNTVTIATSSTTPKGTYQITVVFTETVTSAAFLVPIFLMPLGLMRRKSAARSIWITACLGLALLATSALAIGCGSSGGGGSGSTTPPATHQVTSSGAVSLTIQ
jgi:sugar lactone lactonase YvrE